MFVSRFGDKGRIVEIDYSNLEVIALANFSRDTNLVKQVTDNLNVHDLNSAGYLKIAYEEFMEVKNNPDHELHDTYEKVRDRLKGWEFQYQYGGTARGISFNHGCSLQEAEAFIKLKEDRHPEVITYYQGVEEQIRSNVVNVREFRNDRWQLAQVGMFKGMGGFEYSYKTYETNVWENGQKFVIDRKSTRLNSSH